MVPDTEEVGGQYKVVEEKKRGGEGRRGMRLSEKKIS